MSFTGPSERVDSHFGQQTGRDGFHDGKGDLWVSYTQHHYQAPVAYSGVLRSHWRRVSLTLLKLFFYFTECECIRRHHIWVSNPETAFLSLPLSLFQSTCQSWLDEVPDYCQLSSSSKIVLTKRTRWPQMPIRAEMFSVFCWAKQQSQEHLHHGPIQLCLNPQGRSPQVHLLMWWTHVLDFWNSESSMIRGIRRSRLVPSWLVMWQSTRICLTVLTKITY